jgi:hypothetical protein
VVRRSVAPSAEAVGSASRTPARLLSRSRSFIHYRRRVTLVECAIWGLFGAAAVEGLEWRAITLRTKAWPWKWRDQRWPYLTSVAIRLVIGAGLAAAAGGSNRMGAVAIGVAAPLIIEKLAANFPVGMPADETSRSSSASDLSSSPSQAGVRDAGPEEPIENRAMETRDAE